MSACLPGLFYHSFGDNSMDRWVGKVAVVTGASAGIGAATAIDLVKSGLNVVGVARRVERVEELQSKINGAKGKLFPRQADISKEDEVSELFKWIKESFGTVHILVNNAGISRYGLVTSQDPKYWRDILNTNVLGLANCTQQAFQIMKETGVDDGHIIHINSIAGHGVPSYGVPMTGMYPASKNAVTAFNETLRQELRYLKSKIKTTSISPGLVTTELGEAANAALKESERFDRTTLFSNEGPPPSLTSQDVAEAIHYVLSTPPHVQVHELIIKPVGENA